MWIGLGNGVVSQCSPAGSTPPPSPTAGSHPPCSHSPIVPFPVKIAGVPSLLLTEPVEAAVYYIVAKSLTNAAKRAGASEDARGAVDDERDSRG